MAVTEKEGKAKVRARTDWTRPDRTAWTSILRAVGRELKSGDLVGSCELLLLLCFCLLLLASCFCAVPSSVLIFTHLTGKLLMQAYYCTNAPLMPLFLGANQDC